MKLSLLIIVLILLLCFTDLAFIFGDIYGYTLLTVILFVLYKIHQTLKTLKEDANNSIINDSVHDSIRNPSDN